jgi:hypothetical protein
VTSERKIAANRANSLRSTGARTPEGRARSAMNARKHGLYSKKEVLRREDSIAFENRYMKWMASADVQDDREEFLVYLNVCQSFDFEHAQRAHVERISSLVENADDNEAQDVYKLGKRLFADPHGPIALYGINPFYNHKKKTSGNGEVVNPNDPALLVNELESSRAGCEWLRDQWLELRERLDPPHYWTGIDRLKAVRLLGRQPVDVLEDERVAEVYFAGSTLDSSLEGTLDDLESDIDSERLQRLELEVHSRWPDLCKTDEEAPAREVLVDLVERNIERLDEMIAIYAENAETTLERRLARLRLDDSAKSKSIRDYKMKSASAFHRGLEACEKYRKRRKDESRPRRDGGIPSADDVRREPIDQRQRMADGWQQAGDLSWAYEASAAIDGAAQAGDVVDEVRDRASDGDVATVGLGPCGGTEMGSTKGREGNEAKFDENVITSQLPEPVGDTADSGAVAGLDSVSSQRRDGVGCEDGELRGRRDAGDEEGGQRIAECGKTLVGAGTERCSATGLGGSVVETDAGSGSWVGWDRAQALAGGPGDVGVHDSAVQSSALVLGGEVSAPSGEA